ncbi:hypothetical protein ACIPUA_17495 [Providencia sp. AGC89]|nr:hypothetical protein [Providencia rettgeri]MDU7496093.1 plasmid segregation protein ParM [Providencia rettgeri]
MSTEVQTFINQLGHDVVDDLSGFKNVNRIYILGGGGTLIESAIRKAWAHIDASKIKLLDSPQTALVEAIAEFNRK